MMDNSEPIEPVTQGKEHDVIYLAPVCCHSGEWCQDDAPYDCDCHDGPHPWTKYTRTTPAPSQQTGANGQMVEIININGRDHEVDIELATLVRALNQCGMATIASCSGHGHRPGNIALADGREIMIARHYDEARKFDTLFLTDVNGNST
jgi:hypothetical protein